MGTSGVLISDTYNPGILLLLYRSKGECHFVFLYIYISYLTLTDFRKLGYGLRVHQLAQ